MKRWRSSMADMAGALVAAMVPVLFMFRVLVANQPWSRRIENDFFWYYHVYNTHAGYFSFTDNWDSDWRASVNDLPVDIKLLFGTFKSVALPPGTNTVVFSYRPHFW